MAVHGELEQIEQPRALVAAQAEQLPARRRPPLHTVVELVEVWLAAAHDGKPSTWRNDRQAVRRISLTALELDALREHDLGGRVLTLEHGCPTRC